MVGVTLDPTVQNLLRLHIMNGVSGDQDRSRPLWLKFASKYAQQNLYFLDSRKWKPLIGGFSFTAHEPGTQPIKAVGLWVDPAHSQMFLELDATMKRGGMKLQEVEGGWYAHIRFRRIKRKGPKALKRLAHRGFARAVLQEAGFSRSALPVKRYPGSVPGSDTGAT
jgi:hypothetical protein